MISLTYPTTRIASQAGLVSATWIQTAGSHDIIRAVYSRADFAEPLFRGAPVKAEWSTTSGTITLCGYVHRVDPSYGKSDSCAVTIVGPSWPLQRSGEGVWTDVTASSVVRDIAFQFGLSVDVEEHPVVLPQVMQAGRSYWQLLRQLSADTGYVLRMSGDTLVFRSRRSLVEHFRPISPAMEVRAFSPKLGDFTPELGAARATRRAYGIDLEQGSIVTDFSDLQPLRGDSEVFGTALVPGAVSHSPLEAECAVEAALEANRFTQLARMECDGAPQLVPERTVWPVGIPSQLAGHWVVRAVEHRFDGAKEYTVATVGTDGLGGSLDLMGEAPPTMGAAIDPHRPSALSKWPYSEPVLCTLNAVTGSPGVALRDYAWVASSTTARTA